MTNHQNHMQKRLQSLSELKSTESKYQRYARPKYQDRVWISDYQHKLYRTALLGRKAFSKQEWYKMTATLREKVIAFYEKAQKVLNRWKQQIINEMFEELCFIGFDKFTFNPFERVFDDTVIGVKKFGKTIDDTFQCSLSFTQLKITREQIIQKLIEEGILPKDFYQLERSWL